MFPPNTRNTYPGMNPLIGVRCPEAVFAPDLEYGEDFDRVLRFINYIESNKFDSYSKTLFHFLTRNFKFVWDIYNTNQFYFTVSQKEVIESYFEKSLDAKIHIRYISAHLMQVTLITRHNLHELV